ncbi:MAG: hypothetical protein JWM73_1774 [Solirubrobacterales bacterium]|nr:hypothetical protein [Solirubrobacterales bacterium]
MPNPIDLTGEIRSAIDGAALRGATLALAYVRPDGAPAVAFRGSTHVHDAQTLALWVRKRDEGLAAAIEAEPRVSLVFYEPGGPGAMFLSLAGRARLAPELDDEVYDRIIEGEQQQDPERKGVAMVIDVDEVTGAGADGYFQQSRS